jgi:acetyl-CoA carboxylase carboxyl transferase beta subunit/acetyl-CoA carboxylase carboxyl transferase alpha subunit
MNKPEEQIKSEIQNKPEEKNKSEEQIEPVKHKRSKKQKEPKTETAEQKVDAYDRYLLVRKKERPRARDLIPKIFDRFEQYREGSPYDPNIIAGYAELDGMPLFVIGQNWRTVIDRKILSTISAKGYSLALEVMKLAEKYHKPLITLIDTPGGDPLEESAELLQCWKISDCIRIMASLKVPTVSIIIGEGGSGGALSLQVADRTYMLENSIFSVISPEGCARILIKGLNRKPREEKQKRYREMANLLKPTPQDMLDFKIIDGIVREPEKGIHRDQKTAAKNIRYFIKKALSELGDESIETILERRYRRFMSYGEWQELPIEPKVSPLRRFTRGIMKGMKKIFRREHKAPFTEEDHPTEWPTDEAFPKFFKCKSCGEETPFKKYLKGFKICPKCGSTDREFYPSASEWIRHLVDRGSFRERDVNLVPLDPINFGFREDNGTIKRYRDDIEKDFAKTGVHEALLIGTARLRGQDIVLAVSEYGFRGGSLSSVVGEKFVRAVNYANQLQCPLVSVSMTGGARMQEGILSLMQMAKTNMALTRIKVPYISILADPTMAGSLSSYVSQGDIHIAEPNAEIGFAGTRVVEGYLRTRIRDKKGHSPSWYHPDFYLERGGINEIIPRDKMRDRVHDYLELLKKF